MGRRAAEYGRVYMPDYMNPQWKWEAAFAAATPLAGCKSSAIGPDRREQSGRPGRGRAPVSMYLRAGGQWMASDPAWYPVRKAPTCEPEQPGEPGAGDEVAGTRVGALSGSLSGQWTRQLPWLVARSPRSEGCRASKLGIVHVVAAGALRHPVRGSAWRPGAAGSEEQRAD